MALRLLEAIVPGIKPEGLLKILEGQDLPCLWTTTLDNGNTLLHVLLPSEQTEHISDVLTGYYSDAPDCFKLIILPVEFALPKPAEGPEPETEEKPGAESPKPKGLPARISRDELYADVVDGTKLNWVFILTVVLSSLVAAIGLMRNDVVIIIGAMVIAPLLGPNVALALGSTLGDLGLALKSLKTFSIGLVTVLVVALVVGTFFHVDPAVPSILSRTVMKMSDILLALASGSAGALAYTTGVSTSLIGVMVAVALLPPLVTAGLLASIGQWHLALGAFLLFVMNVTCVNLAGVVTFLLQGIRPKTWWESRKAAKAVRFAILFWLIVLTILFLSLLWWKT